MAHVPRLYLSAHLGPGPLTLDADQAKRLANVMRLRAGDLFRLFNGDGREWSASVATVDRARVQAAVHEVVRQEPPLPLVLEAWVGLVRPNRFDWAIEKLTEAGADVIRPLLSEHSGRGEGSSAQRQERWNRLAIEAAEQSGRLRLPVIEPSASFARLLEMWRGALIVGAPGGRPWLETVALLPERGHLAVAVGPEGGFSDTELAAAKAHGALAVDLSPNILRTETAAVVGVALVRSLGR